MKSRMVKLLRNIGVSSEHEDTAADWIARRDAGMSPIELAELDAWLATDARHAAAFAEMEKAWGRFNVPRREGRGDALFAAISERRLQARRRRHRALALAGAGLAAVAALAFAWLPREAAPDRVAPSITVRPDRQVLADGSRVELNAAAQFMAEFTPEQRTVRLVRGEALFEVAKDPGRPFVVVVGQVEVRAVGTIFTVRNEPDKVALVVTEGRVAVGDVRRPDAAGASASGPDPIYVRAGCKATIPVDLTAAQAEVKDLSSREVAQALAWRSRRVEFTATPLKEAVALFNRQPGGRLVLGNDATGALRITGIFWTDDPEGFSRLLVSSLGLKADTDPNGSIVLRQ